MAKAQTFRTISGAASAIAKNRDREDNESHQVRRRLRFGWDSDDGEVGDVGMDDPELTMNPSRTAIPLIILQFSEQADRLGIILYSDGSLHSEVR